MKSYCKIIKTNHNTYSKNEETWITTNKKVTKFDNLKVKIITLNATVFLIYICINLSEDTLILSIKQCKIQIKQLSNDRAIHF